MENINIVAFLGQARSGKDTAAEYLSRKYNYVRIGLADPIKEFCRKVLKFNDKQLYGDAKEIIDPRYNKTPREAMQTLGTEWARNFYQNIWVDYAMATARKVLSGNEFFEPYRGVVISDCRFRNEVDAVLSAGGRVYRLIREGAHGNVGVMNHASETEQKSIPNEILTGVIYVPEGIDQFHEVLNSIFEEK